MHVRGGLVRSYRRVCPIKCIQSKLLYERLGGNIIMDGIVAHILSLESLQLVHQCRRVGHAFV